MLFERKTVQILGFFLFGSMRVFCFLNFFSLHSSHASNALRYVWFFFIFFSDLLQNYFYAHATASQRFLLYKSITSHPYPVPGSLWGTPISSHTQSFWSWCKCNRCHLVPLFESSEAAAYTEVPVWRYKESLCPAVVRACVLSLYCAAERTFFFTKYPSKMRMTARAKSKNPLQNFRILKAPSSLEGSEKARRENGRLKTT